MFASAEQIKKRFRAEIPQEKVFLRYNIAPTQTVLTLPATQPRRIEYMQWGLIPSWAKDDTMSAKMMNARAETVMEKPSFRTAFTQRRCLVIAHGFYEWEKKTGQPYYVSLTDGDCFAMAGLWEEWKNPSSGIIVRSCTIITTEPNSLIAPYHHRMAVILAKEDEELWLNPATPLSVAHGLLRPYPADAMRIYPVSKNVNYIEQDNASLIEPLHEHQVHHTRAGKTPLTLFDEDHSADYSPKDTAHDIIGT